MTTSTPSAHDSAATARQRRAELLHRLHDELLVLPNAWDVASARLVVDAGAAAVATTSAGVSWSLGTPDGDRLPSALLIELLRRLVTAVDVPVTADVETGYGDTPADLAETVRQVLATGVVGVNIEDSVGPALRPITEQAERIAVVRATAAEVGVPLFVNARTDTHLLAVGEPAGRESATVARAEAYLAAGADGIFVPGLLDPAVLRRLVRAVPAPVNVMAGPGAPSVAELADIGVRRVSVGAGIAQAAYAVTRRAAVELLTAGTYRALDGGLDYGELNSLSGRDGAR